MKPTVLLQPQFSQNREPYVTCAFGPHVTAEQSDSVYNLMTGYGLRQGWGMGRPKDASDEAQKLARKLRRLGWSVSVEG